MKKFLIVVTTQQPLLIGDRHGDGTGALRSQTCIPGQTLRGAFAAQWQHTDPRQWFDRAIEKGEVGFSPLYPVAEEPGPNHMWGPVPFSAVSCKRFAGFGHDHDKHGVHDRALERSTWLKGDTGTKHDMSCGGKLADGVCGSPLEKFRGFLHMQPSQIQQIKVAHRLMTRTAVSDQIDSVVDGQLFCLKPLEEEQVFAGLIQMPDDLDDKPLRDIETLRLGKARSRGLGSVSVEIKRLENTFAGSLEARVTALQKRLKQQGIKVPEGQTWVTLDLWSPLLLRDPLMRDRLLFERTDFAFDDVAIEPIALDAVWVGGWNGLLNLPRPHRQALAPGGVVALKISGKRSAALQAMEAIETYGLGENWADGFGRVLFCHPFHHQLEGGRP